MLNKLDKLYARAMYTNMFLRNLIFLLRTRIQEIQLIPRRILSMEVI